MLKMEMSGQALETLLRKVVEETGYDFSQYRHGTIRRRVFKRLLATGAADLDAYLRLLDRCPGEYRMLVRELTIKVSRFFRNPYVFELMEKIVLPEILEKKKREDEPAIRVWSAGCAHGEEAYSIAMLLVEYLRKKKKRPSDYFISIFATDIDDDALAKARRASYEDEALYEVKKLYLDRYFVYNGRYSVTGEIRDLVVFCQHDLTSTRQIAPPAGVVHNYDLILCRNVLIYFSLSLQRRVMFNLLRSLNPGGFLVLGEAESVLKEFEPLLSLVDARARIYKKNGERHEGRH